MTSVVCQNGKTVYLVFTVQGSGNFQGYARLISLGPVDKVKDFLASSNLFTIEWLKRYVNIPIYSLILC